MILRKHNLKAMLLVLSGIITMSQAISAFSAEVIPNGTITTYKNGGPGSISETYTPPTNYKFKKIHPDDIIKYFNWRPHELFELINWSEGPTKIEIGLENRHDSPDLFIGSVDGELTTEGQGVGPGGPITWKGDLKGISFYILAAPLKYYAQAESDIPIVFRVDLPEGDNRQYLSASNDLRLEGLYLIWGNTFINIPQTLIRLESGDLYNRNLNAKKTFTLIVNTTTKLPLA